MRPLKFISCLLVVGSTTVQAAERCHIPLSDWRPREALKAQLESNGWEVRSIKAEDGCYEAAATDGAGRHVIAQFDPHSFQSLAVKSSD